MTIPIRGTAALFVASTIVAVTAIWLPAYRRFLLISIGIGVAVAGGLFFWPSGGSTRTTAPRRRQVKQAPAEINLTAPVYAAAVLGQVDPLFDPALAMPICVNARTALLDQTIARSG